MRHGNYDDSQDSKINWRTLKALIPHLLEYKRRVALALLCLVAAKLASVGSPFILKYLVDYLDVDSDAVLATLAVPVGLVLAYGLVRFSNVLFSELRDTVFGRVTERAMRKIGIQVFEHLHQMDLDFHLNRRTGGLARDIERGTTGISFLMRFMVFNIVPTLLEITLVIGILLVNYGIGFAIITFVSVVAYAAFSFAATEWRTQFVREMNKADSTSNTRAVDSLLNYETVKYFTNEAYEAERYDRELGFWELARRKNRLSMFALNGGQALIIASAMTSMMALAAHRVVAGAMSLGDFVLINAFMMQLFMPLNFLGFVYREIKGSMANIEKMFQLLAQTPKVVDAASAKPLLLREGKIEFKDVEFAYRPDRQILEQISFTIEPGQKVAVVGASGAGKSTLVKLLFRFYDVTGGCITIDDQDIRTVSQLSLREQIGIVPQDTVLFNDTIVENIRYGRPGASDAEVEDAMRMSNLYDFIQSLPEKGETKVGERGLKLSGGEKQRVAIARTILKRPPILVFDEATSSLDSQSEQAILAALQEVSEGHTSLVIAHRLSTVVDADKIVVLDKGRIVEQGLHQQLLEANGVYANLWYTQQKQRVEPPAIKNNVSH